MSIFDQVKNRARPGFPGRSLAGDKGDLWGKVKGSGALDRLPNGGDGLIGKWGGMKGWGSPPAPPEPRQPKLPPGHQPPPPPPPAIDPQEQTPCVPSRTNGCLPGTGGMPPAATAKPPMMDEDWFRQAPDPEYQEPKYIPCVPSRTNGGCMSGTGGWFLVGPGGEAVAPASPQPQAQPPMAQPPIAQPPIAQPPIAQPPIAQPPIAQPPQVEPQIPESVLPEETGGGDYEDLLAALTELFTQWFGPEGMVPLNQLQPTMPQPPPHNLMTAQYSWPGYNWGRSRGWGYPSARQGMQSWL